MSEISVTELPVSVSAVASSSLTIINTVALLISPEEVETVIVKIVVGIVLADVGDSYDQHTLEKWPFLPNL